MNLYEYRLLGSVALLLCIVTAAPGQTYKDKMAEASRLRMSGRPAEALTALDEALRLASSDSEAVDALWRIAWLHEDAVPRPERAKAVGVYERLVRDYPNAASVPRAYHRLGQLRWYGTHGELDVIVLPLWMAFGGGPAATELFANPRTQEQVFASLRQSCHYREALPYFEKGAAAAQSFNPWSLACRNMIAEADILMEDRDEAVKILREIAVLDLADVTPENSGGTACCPQARETGGSTEDVRILVASMRRNARLLLLGLAFAGKNAGEAMEGLTTLAEECKGTNFVPELGQDLAELRANSTDVGLEEMRNLLKGIYEDEQRIVKYSRTPLDGDLLPLLDRIESPEPEARIQLVSDLLAQREAIALSLSKIVADANAGSLPPACKASALVLMGELGLLQCEQTLIEEQNWEWRDAEAGNASSKTTLPASAFPAKYALGRAAFGDNVFYAGGPAPSTLARQRTLARALKNLTSPDAAVRTGAEDVVLRWYALIGDKMGSVLRSRDIDPASNVTRVTAAHIVGEFRCPETKQLLWHIDLEDEANVCGTYPSSLGVITTLEQRPCAVALIKIGRRLSPREALEQVMADYPPQHPSRRRYIAEISVCIDELGTRVEYDKMLVKLRQPVHEKDKRETTRLERLEAIRDVIY